MMHLWAAAPERHTVGGLTEKASNDRFLSRWILLKLVRRRRCQINSEIDRGHNLPTLKGAAMVDADLPRYDRDFLLSPAKRNQIVELWEVEKFGRDSFGDPDAVSLYGMTPNQWHARGVRILVALALAGRVEEASRVSARTLEIEPSYGITSTRSVGLGRGLAENFERGLRMLGVPE